MAASPENAPAVTPRQEAERLYTALFRAPVPDPVAERFGRAAPRLDATAEAGELRAYRYAIAHVADLEALELAGRHTRRLGLLSRKFQLMAYLGETLPENRARFIKDGNSVVAAWAALAGGTLRTVAKLVLGLVLLRRMQGA